jgi:TPR repeat protein
VLATYRLALSLHLWNTRLLNPRALALAHRAAADGYAGAYILAGRILLEGRGMGEKREAAIEMFRKGAELGDPMGFYLMGLLASQDKTQQADAQRYLMLAKGRGVAQADPALEKLGAA